jgi:hypothetical protein
MHDRVLPRDEGRVFLLLLLVATGPGWAAPHTVQEGFDRPGADYETFEQDHTSPDAENCRAACESDLDTWRMHCQSSHPDAFEPRLISGPFQLVRHGDAGPDRWFGTTSIRGKIDSSGRVEGIAEDATGRVVWQGLLERHERGALPRGSGGFELDRGTGGCSDGVWSNW